MSQQRKCLFFRQKCFFFLIAIRPPFFSSHACRQKTTNIPRFSRPPPHDQRILCTIPQLLISSCSQLRSPYKHPPCTKHHPAQKMNNTHPPPPKPVFADRSTPRHNHTSNSMQPFCRSCWSSRLPTKGVLNFRSSTISTITRNNPYTTPHMDHMRISSFDSIVPTGSQCRT